MKPFSFLLLSFIFLLGACNEPKNDEDITLPGANPVLNTIAHELDEEDGPPFEKECLCDFHDFGEYKISNSEHNIYKRGKGWDPQLYSCSWTWGEDINNIIPEDTNIKVMKIHLLDLDHFEIPNNGTEYGNDSIRKHVIAVYTRISGKGDKCVFDPYKTGKYPKPPQWVEE